MFAVTKNYWNKFFQGYDQFPLSWLGFSFEFKCPGQKFRYLQYINFQSIVCQLHVNPIEKFFLKVTKKIIIPMKVLHLSKLI